MNRKGSHHTNLRELKHVSQHTGEPFRRLFSCSTMDVYVWCEETGDMHGFQLCYRQNRKEKALTWLKDKGFTHRSVDDGENAGERFKMTPILVPDGEFPKEEIRAAFADASMNVDVAVVDFILKKLEEYPS